MRHITAHIEREWMEVDIYKSVEGSARSRKRHVTSHRSSIKIKRVDGSRHI